MSTELLLGIGNIGEKYLLTRHNAGFMIADKFVEKNGEKKTRKFNHSQVWECEFSGKKIVVCKPNTFVNLSGMAARELFEYYEISEENMLVAVDDFNLNLGAMRFRKNGSDGGHNGLKSLIECSSRNFARLRFGIGPLPEETAIIDFVLGKFGEEELKIATEKIEIAVEAIESYYKDGIVAVMNKYNSK
jgi:PTH1 family peptidyl-tRNA hydrolase